MLAFPASSANISSSANIFGMADQEPLPPLDLPSDDAADAQAEADYAAGRVVPHAEVARWLESWGTDQELPVPTPKRR